MTNILFSCSGCSSRLSVDENYVGQVVECPECNQKVLVPEVGRTFQCSHCHTGLTALAGMVGEVVNCPECGATLTVPQSIPNPIHLRRQPSNFIRHNPQYQGRQCSYCGRSVGSDDVLCVNCGTDLKTGRKLKMAPKTPTSSETTTDIFATVTFWTGLLSIWIIPIIFAPICYVSSIISYYRLKRNANLKGAGRRITGAILGMISLIWLFNFWGIRELWQDNMSGDNIFVATNNDELANKEAELLAQQEAQAREENEQIARQQTQARAEKEQLVRQQAQEREKNEQSARQQAQARAEQERLARQQAQERLKNEQIARQQAQAKAEKEQLARQQAQEREKNEYIVRQSGQGVEKLIATGVALEKQGDTAQAAAYFRQAAKLDAALAALQAPAKQRQQSANNDIHTSSRVNDNTTTSVGHLNPWGKAGCRVIGRYGTWNEAYRIKEGMKKHYVNATVDGIEEQLIGSGDFSGSIQRLPEYQIEFDTNDGTWILFEQKF